MRWFFGLLSMSGSLNILKLRKNISMLVNSSVGIVIGRFMLSVMWNGWVFVMWVVFLMFELRLCSVVDEYRYMCGMCVRLMIIVIVKIEYMF